MHHARLGSVIQVLDETGTQAMRLGYSPFGQVNSVGLSLE